MLGRNTRNILSRASKDIILYQWTGMVNSIVELVWIGTTKTNISPYLFQDNCMIPLMNINTKVQQYPIVYHINGKDHIMRSKISGKPMREINLSSYLTTENIYKKWQEKLYIMLDQLTPLCWQSYENYQRHIQNLQKTPKNWQSVYLITVQQTQMKN